MTGLRPQTLGIYDLATNFRKARPDAVTVAQYFQKHGYHTQSLGKIMHQGHGNDEDAASWNVPHWRAKAGMYAGPAAREVKAPQKSNKRKDYGAATECIEAPDAAYGDHQVATEAILRLQAQKTAQKPFFIAVGFIKPHLPFVAPKKYWDLHDATKLPQPERMTPPQGAPSYAPQTGGELRQYADMPDGKTPLTAEQTRQLIHGYYAATSFVDAQVGRVMEALEQTGLRKNTLVVFWGDHGWHLGDHGIWCKHTNYEQATRIPLLISVPGQLTGASPALVETVDICPTLAVLAGLPAPTGLDGRSFASVFKKIDAPHRDHIIHVYPRGQLLGRAIRTDRYRGVEWKIPGDPASAGIWELYDYLKDPGETQNLALEQPQVLQRLQALLASHPEAKPQLKLPAEEPEAAKNNKSRKAAFKQRDSNSDGKLTLEEFLTHQPDPDQAPQRFPRFDTNSDGVLTEEEYVAGGAKR
jgi:iduronate 2-sulfatase